VRGRREHELNVYFIFEPYALELAFALSIYFKCQKHNIPCTVDVSRPVKLEEIPKEIIEAAQVWAGKKASKKILQA